MAKELRELMWDQVGLIRTKESLEKALTRIKSMRSELDGLTIGAAGGYDMSLRGWYDLRSSLLTAKTVTVAALNREESRGAQWREDFPHTDPALEQTQVVGLSGDKVEAAFAPLVRQ